MLRQLGQNRVQTLCVQCRQACSARRRTRLVIDLCKYGESNFIHPNDSLGVPIKIPVSKLVFVATDRPRAVVSKARINRRWDKEIPD